MKPSSIQDVVPMYIVYLPRRFDSFQDYVSIKLLTMTRDLPISTLGVTLVKDC